MVVHDKHGHHHIDYVARPKYEFAYGVEDHHTGDYHGQKEHRDGKPDDPQFYIKFQMAKRSRAVALKNEIINMQCYL